MSKFAEYGMNILYALRVLIPFNVAAYFLFLLLVDTYPSYGHIWGILCWIGINILGVIIITTAIKDNVNRFMARTNGHSGSMNKSNWKNPKQPIDSNAPKS